MATTETGQGAGAGGSDDYDQQLGIDISRQGTQANRQDDLDPSSTILLSNFSPLLSSSSSISQTQPKDDDLIVSSSPTTDNNKNENSLSSPSENNEISDEIKQDVRELLGRKFWEEANSIEIVFEVLFHIKRRNTTIEKEIYCGFIQFISCLYILPVLPHQMENAGYDLKTTYVVTV